AVHAAEIVPALHAALASRGAFEWEDRFGDAVPCAAARRIEDMFEHPQVLAEGMVATLEHPTVGRYRGVANPIRFGRTPRPAPFAAPVLGQDSALLAGMGDGTSAGGSGAPDPGIAHGRQP
ncbi:MAG TPA: CoA transferase, partial [Luteimonas sp.]|nr:CoA transferase [Luteimonas sp.]